jgi:hypothetical protein
VQMFGASCQKKVSLEYVFWVSLVIESCSKGSIYRNLVHLKMKAYCWLIDQRSDKQQHRVIGWGISASGPVTTLLSHNFWSDQKIKTAANQTLGLLYLGCASPKPVKWEKKYWDPDSLPHGFLCFWAFWVRKPLNTANQAIRTAANHALELLYVGCASPKQTEPEEKYLDLDSLPHGFLCCFKFGGF